MYAKLKDNNRSRRVYQVLAFSIGNHGDSLISLRFVDLIFEKKLGLVNSAAELNSLAKRRRNAGLAIG